MQELIEYIKTAKANGWCLDTHSLAKKYKVPQTEVKKLVEKIHNIKNQL